ncbi:MAG TPA: hypothetical protein VMV40_01665 [Acidiferrobacter sp.]|nr:hypothetical protein [Acidiferrobacter sp.]
MNIGVLVAIFFGFLFAPFIPGLYELFFPKDDKPLSIEMDYSKDARYFAQSFRRLMHSYIPGETAGSERTKVQLSSGLETIKSFGGDFKTDSYDTDFKSILLVRGDLTAGRNNNFSREVYVLGDADFGNNNVLRAAAVDKNVNVGRNTRVVRWLDAEGSINAGRGSNLGISTTAGGAIALSRDCTFKRLYGNPVCTPTNDVRPALPVDETEEATMVLDYSGKIHTDSLKFDKPTEINGDLITIGELVITDRCTINGSIKTDGKITIDSGAKEVLITGSIISESDITIRGNVKVLGNIFSQKAIFLKGAEVGMSGGIKSVISKRHISLGENVKIYGFASTEGAGVVI